MYCPNCGKEIPDSSKSCPSCGATFEKAQEQPTYTPTPEDNKKAWIIGISTPVVIVLLLMFFPTATFTVFFIMLGLAGVAIVIELINWLKSKL